MPTVAASPTRERCKNDFDCSSFKPVTDLNVAKRETNPAQLLVPDPSNVGWWGFGRSRRPGAAVAAACARSRCPVKNLSTTLSARVPNVASASPDISTGVPIVQPGHHDPPTSWEGLAIVLIPRRYIYAQPKSGCIRYIPHIISLPLPKIFHHIQCNNKSPPVNIIVQSTCHEWKIPISDVCRVIYGVLNT